jgi:lysyl-tRNA synthetase class 2
MQIELLKVRAYALQCIREFFIREGYWEAETPLINPCLIPEACLEVFKTTYLPPGTTGEEGIEYYLIPSPELWMKRLLALGSGPIFQLTKCFRNLESKGKYHNPEFTMLEWYSTGHTYWDEADFTEELLGYVIDKLAEHFSHLFGPVASSLLPPFKRLSMQEAFRTRAGIRLDACSEQKILLEEAKRLNLAVNEEDSWEEVFNKIFLTLIEPELPVEKPLILYDYPALIPTLAKQKEFYVERWELYIKGVEIANCFTEEINREKVAEFITGEATRKKQCCLVQHPADTELPAFFGQDYPACSGVALGIDRLLMVLLNLKSIDEIMLSAFSIDINR